MKEKSSTKTKKVDFRKIEVENVTGEKEYTNISKMFGNLLHSQGSTLEVTELGKAIWRKGVVELTEEDINVVKEYANKLQSYILRTAIMAAVIK